MKKRYLVGTETCMHVVEREGPLLGHKYPDGKYRVSFPAPGHGALSFAIVRGRLEEFRSKYGFGGEHVYVREVPADSEEQLAEYEARIGEARAALAMVQLERQEFLATLAPRGVRPKAERYATPTGGTE